MGSDYMHTLVSLTRRDQVGACIAYISRVVLMKILSCFSTHWSDELSILLIEIREGPGVKDVSACRYTRSEIICFHNRMICWVKFEDHDIARIGRYIGWNKLMRICLRSHLDCVGAGTGRGGGRGGGSCSC